MPPIALDDTGMKYGGGFSSKQMPPPVPIARSTITKMPAVIQPAVTVPASIPSERIEIDVTRPGDGGDGHGRRRNRETSMPSADDGDETSSFPPAAQSIISDIIGQLRHSKRSRLYFAICYRSSDASLPGRTRIDLAGLKATSWR